MSFQTYMFKGILGISKNTVTMSLLLSEPEREILSMSGKIKDELRELLLISKRNKIDISEIDIPITFTDYIFCKDELFNGNIAYVNLDRKDIERLCITNPEIEEHHMKQDFIKYSSNGEYVVFYSKTHMLKTILSFDNVCENLIKFSKLLLDSKLITEERDTNINTMINQYRHTVYTELKLSLDIKIDINYWNLLVEEFYENI